MNSLDLNPFQANLLASGASDSEVSIWDLNKFSTPMTPGAKAQPLEDVRCVAWNKQVQHILATTGKYFFFLFTFNYLCQNWLCSKIANFSSSGRKDGVISILPILSPFKIFDMKFGQGTIH